MASLTVFDASTLNGAAIKHDGAPMAVLRKAVRTDRIARSAAVEPELLEILHRPGLARFIDPLLREEMLGRLMANTVQIEPAVAISACRDARDTTCLEPALAADARRIVFSDADLLEMAPWRGIAIIRPGACLQR